MPLAAHPGSEAMPTTRKRKAHGSIEFNELTRMHLETGDCLIAGPGKGCGCGLRDYDGNEREDLARVMQSRMGENLEHK